MKIGTFSFLILNLSFLIISTSCAAQPLGKKLQFTHQDTLRGTITPERAWWNVLRYDIQVTPDYGSKTIQAQNRITIQVLKPENKLQLDLQEPMIIDSIFLFKDLVSTERLNLTFVREGNAWFVTMPNLAANSKPILEVNYHGKPREAVRPPWDGGWIWTKDKMGRPWMSVACQGLGASVWYPCKDHQSDEPDNGASLSITVPDTLVAVGNGRLQSKTPHNNGTTTYTWAVKNPINNYNIIPYIGKYVTWHENFAGEKGNLDCDYWVLDYDLDKAKKQFTQADKMLKCFEYWFGPYPFYEDGYKLVEAPHLGMEHQSAVAYGNKFENGYLGRDLSGTGWGLKWDFIIVHESGHEWFANSITSNDIADMWVHEGFTNYSETLFTTCEYGVEAGNEYLIGTRAGIRNDIPIIGPYGVNQEGSGDMYPKSGNMLHTIRQIINNDSAFRNILRGLNKTYYHKTVTSKEVEAYISREAKIDFSKVFDQYLRTTQIPVLEYAIKGKDLKFRFTDCVKGFGMPVKVTIGKDEKWIRANEDWTIISGANTGNFTVDKNFYINTKKVNW
ncbi:peptidase M1 [Niastella koreensis]|uniref:Peptidase M1 membrane alanine aminopeptidase n=2 Tax=Niastella koreensis TaxID=354356 RepID=G8TGI5_NIAKG|nr:M1 family metallopeptidase [Niastella koreensis]AEV97408.1 Peptidase M1 membrane alanine aminopeptidase [Niastella koreensis GR20-10]OQP45509.1 peptidase M1 [Niastella koreensis]